jgi:hypothetical protein
MVPTEGEWNSALKRAAGDRGRARLRRLERAKIGSREVDRKRVLADALARKKRA